MPHRLSFVLPTGLFTFLCTNKDADSLTDVYCFRFFVSVRREPYPDYERRDSLPGHTISVIPPLTLHNLLPVELTFKVEPSGYSNRLQPGRKMAICQVCAG